ncbi:MAG: class I SAM-dependent methyltransferase [Pseudomonadota bacterium]
MSAFRKLARNIAVRSPFALMAQRWSERRVAEAAGDFPEKDENGVPIPPALLMATIAGHADWRGFLTSGKASLATFADVIDRNGGDFRNAGRILDFGCGCGRLARHAPEFTSAELHGVDYNQDLVTWCDQNLPGSFTANKLRPPLAFPDDHFNAMYLLSVFTHLRIPTQKEWLEEFHRVLKPGAYCIITFHDEVHVNLPVTNIDPEQLKRDGFAYYNNAAEGSNLIATFQTNDQISEMVAPLFNIREIVPSTDTPVTQAILVLQKK